MKKNLYVVLISILLITMLVVSPGCASKKSDQAANSAYKATSQSKYSGEGAYSPPSAPEMSKVNSDIERDVAEAPKGSGSVGITSINTQLPENILGDRKVIFNAFMVLEVEEFDTKLSMIKSMIENTGIGYVQSSNMRSHKISSNPETYRKEGTIVLRVAQNKFNSVIDDVQKLGKVLENTTGTEEVTDQYYDTKYRTQMYEAERERIMEYLKKANDLNTMLQLERKLSEITYEIERLKGSLRKWDSLVEFSTITIELRETIPGLNSNSKVKSYSTKVLDAFIDSFTETIRAIGDLIIFLIRMLPTVIIIAIIYLLAKPLIKALIRKHKSIDS